MWILVFHLFLTGIQGYCFLGAHGITTGHYARHSTVVSNCVFEIMEWDRNFHIHSTWTHSRNSSMSGCHAVTRTELISIHMSHWYYICYLYIRQVRTPTAKLAHCGNISGKIRVKNFAHGLRFAVFCYGEVTAKNILHGWLYSERPRGAGFRSVNPAERWRENPARALARAGFSQHLECGVHRSESSPEGSFALIPRPVARWAKTTP